MDHAASSLLRASAMAVSVLRRVMLDGKAPAASRIRAAEKILETAFRAVKQRQQDARWAKQESDNPFWLR